MTARAHVAHNFPRRGVDIYLSQGTDVLDFQPPTAQPVHDAGSADQPLRLSDDVARALYEALAEHYGHTGHDMRALRRDYEHERGRLDKVLDHLLGTVQ